MSVCDEPSYTCGAKRDAITSTANTFSLSIAKTRSVNLVLGATTIPLQSRERSTQYSKLSANSKTGYFWVVTYDLFEALYSPCWAGENNTLTAAFSDEYTTLDTELEFLDLRHDTAVIKTVTNHYKITDADSVAETDFISVFTGYDSQTYSSYVFDGFPIAENITHDLYIKGVKTVLHSQYIGRGYPLLNLLMPTFPWSPWGIRIDTPWAKEVDWYRQDLRKYDGTGMDGDAYLFYPDWSQACGKMSQSLDSINRDMVYALDHAYFTALPHTNNFSLPEVITNSLFRGSVAFDVGENRFYSISVPADHYAVDPQYVTTTELVIDGVATAMPLEKVRDRVMSGDPPTQETDVDGNLKWTAEKDSEYTCYYPIAPL